MIGLKANILKNYRKGNLIRLRRVLKRYNMAEENIAKGRKSKGIAKAKGNGKRDTQRGFARDRVFDKEGWKPKTEMGRKVKNGEITDIDQILDKGIRILESEIIDALIPNLQSDLLQIGQSKGKFGGGKASIWRQTQKKTSEGNKPSFATLAVVGNEDGYVGIGLGKARETVPAREKALRKAKLGLIKIRRSSIAGMVGEPHTIPLKGKGKCSSVEVILMPAPRGKGLIVEKEIAKILKLAGVKDVYSKTFGHTKTKLNLIKACIEALKDISKAKLQEDYIKKAGVIEGKA
jgi:small subunit ribosomal protein S5